MTDACLMTTCEFMTLNALYSKNFSYFHYFIVFYNLQEVVYTFFNRDLFPNQKHFHCMETSRDKKCENFGRVLFDNTFSHINPDNEGNWCD